MTNRNDKNRYAFIGITIRTVSSGDTKSVTRAARLRAMARASVNYYSTRGHERNRQFIESKNARVQWVAQMENPHLM